MTSPVPLVMPSSDWHGSGRYALAVEFVQPADAAAIAAVGHPFTQPPQVSGDPAPP